MKLRPIFSGLLNCIAPPPLGQQISPQQMMSEAKVRNQYSDVFCKKPLPPYKFVDSPYMTIDPNEKRGLKGPPGKPNWKPGGSSRPI